MKVLTPDAGGKKSAGATISRRGFCALAAVGYAGIALTENKSGVAASAKAWNQLPVSPLVHSDGRVTFLFPVGKSRKVVLQIGGFPSQDMTHRAEGFWHATVGPLEPGIYSYAFEVDGVRVLDPLNPWVKKNLFYPASLILVPGQPASLWQDMNVPHGAVTEHFYHSAIADDNRNFYVYTPPGYDPRGRTRYPVLYLLHGYSDTAGAWTKAGRANFILDNLIAGRRAVPMIIVMPLGYGDDAIVSRTTAGIADTAIFNRNMTHFQSQLLKEIMPRIAANYRIKTGPANTAIAGLSMGGGEALIVGLNNLSHFSWICGLSSYCGAEGLNFSSVFPGLTRSDNDRIKLLWVSCGRQDPLVGKANRHLDAWLTSRGVHFKNVWTSGGHQWRVWRDNLVHFAPLLFRTQGPRG